MAKDMDEEGMWWLPLDEVDEDRVLCEANAIIPYPTEARQMVRDVIEGYLGEDALERVEDKKERREKEYRKLFKAYGIADAIEGARKRLREEEDLYHSGVTDDEDGYEYGNFDEEEE